MRVTVRAYALFLQLGLVPLLHRVRLLQCCRLPLGQQRSQGRFPLPCRFKLQFRRCDLLRSRSFPLGSLRQLAASLLEVHQQRLGLGPHLVAHLLPLRRGRRGICSLRRRLCRRRQRFISCNVGFGGVRRSCCQPPLEVVLRCSRRCKGRAAFCSRRLKLAAQFSCGHLRLRSRSQCVCQRASLSGCSYSRLRSGRLQLGTCRVTFLRSRCSFCPCNGQAGLQLARCAASLRSCRVRCLQPRPRRLQLLQYFL